MSEALRTAAAIFLAGGTGALARFGLSTFVQRAVSATGTGLLFPWGTATVNALGCLAAGSLIAALEGVAAGAGVEASLFYSRLLLTGFLGGFTTFSAFSVETLGLLRTGATGAAALYVAGSALAFPSLCAAGFACTRILLGVWKG